MGLFDFFKNNQHDKKVALAYKCYKPEMVGMVFPLSLFYCLLAG